MLQLELNNRIASAVGKCETELRALVLAAARDLATAKGEVEKDVVIPIEDGMTAVVNGVKGFVLIQGSHVGDLGQLLKILDGVHRILGGKSAALAQTIAPQTAAKVAEPEPESEPEDAPAKTDSAE